MTPQDEDRDTVQTSAYDPFPQPQTIPAGWDTSGFFSDPRADSIMEDGDSTEDESR